MLPKKPKRAMFREMHSRARKYLAQTPAGLVMTNAQLDAGAKVIVARGIKEAKERRLNGAAS